MNKHTPAPWCLSDAERYVVAKNAELIADCFAESSEDRANARLIAQSPAMLEALRECLGAMDSMREQIERTKRSKTPAKNTTMRTRSRAP